MRYDLQIVASWIEPGARVLDLGCGQGDLLDYLRGEKDARGMGIEIDGEKVQAGIGRGLSILQGDIGEEIKDYPKDMFDYVILSQTLQQVYDPLALIREMLRVGRMGIVSFPNFSHYRARLQLLFSGVAPTTRELPYQWYDTPNIRVITIRDFTRFCAAGGFTILKSAAIKTYYKEETGEALRLLPNLRASYGVFLLERGDRDRREIESGKSGEKPLF
ncbi:MAG: methionine biosynthesis protein MetW [Desulfovibrionaceae bacterium]|nr:methionine biosynthesis protein MetW [Desulfovibrionaceae bacterium]